jgi:polyisoprenoid-binding protein YceI
MERRFTLAWSVAAVFAIGSCLVALPSAVGDIPLGIDSARVTIAGTSNIHEYTAATTKVRVTRGQVGAEAAGAEFWDNAVKPGAVQAFEIAIAAGTLTSPKEGLDKNMYKALKVQQHPDITFKLLRFDLTGKPAGTAKAIGVLNIAGVDREVAMDITTKRVGSTLTVQGRVDLLMTDYGIKPPTAMMGMLKTDPKVTVTFETVLSIPLT